MCASCRGLPSQAFEYIRYNKGIMGEDTYPYRGQVTRAAWSPSSWSAGHSISVLPAWAPSSWSAGPPRAPYLFSPNLGSIFLVCRALHLYSPSLGSVFLVCRVPHLCSPRLGSIFLVCRAPLGSPHLCSPSLGSIFLVCRAPISVLLPASGHTPPLHPLEDSYSLLNSVLSLHVHSFASSVYLSPGAQLSWGLFALSMAAPSLLMAWPAPPAEGARECHLWASTLRIHVDSAPGPRASPLTSAPPVHGRAP